MRRHVSIAVAGVLLAALCGIAPAFGASGGLRAFLLASSPDSLVDFGAHSAAIGVVYPTYFYCSPGGGHVLGAAAPAVDESIAARHVPVMPRFTCQERGAVHRLLDDRESRRRVLAQLTALVDDGPGYRGLSLDLENDGPADRTALNAFVGELARRLHARGKRLSVVVVGVTHEDPRSSTGFYDDRTLAALADEVFLLGWGVHWEGSGPGPIAPLPWVRQVAGYFASLPHASRFVLGAPMYGLDWAAGRRRGRAYQYSSLAKLAAEVGAEPVRDRASGEMTFSYVRAGVVHTVWYLDARAVAARLAAGRAAGLAVGVWRLGSEDQRLWLTLP
jgi:spore germination protein